MFFHNSDISRQVKKWEPADEKTILCLRTSKMWNKKLKAEAIAVLKNTVWDKA